MSPLHSLSPCCRGSIRRFGKRRRQCCHCRGTWSVQQKKRGRKRLAVNRAMALRYIAGKNPSAPTGVDVRRRRMRASLSALIAHAYWEYPEGNEPLIAIVDGMWQVLEQRHSTVYFILLRPVTTSCARILPPVVVPGKESGFGWQQALKSIPLAYRMRIRAIVCDGEPHLVHQVRMDYGWRIQRCHFHGIASIKNYVSAGPLSRNPTFGAAVLQSVHTVLTTEHDDALNRGVRAIRRYCIQAKNGKLRSRLRGLLRDLDDFRTYVHHPELQLPTTSNAAESLIQRIRDLQYRARGFRTIASFSKWVTAICFYKKTVVCNGKNQQNKRL